MQVNSSIFEIWELESDSKTKSYACSYGEDLPEKLILGQKWIKRTALLNTFVDVLNLGLKASNLTISRKINKTKYF